MSDKKHTLQDSIDEVRAVREAQTEEYEKSRFYDSYIDTINKNIKCIEKTKNSIESLKTPNNIFYIEEAIHQLNLIRLILKELKK